MFTEDMIREQFAALGTEALPANLKPAGSKNGFLAFNQSAEIAPYFEKLNTDGYRTVFFLSPANAGVESQLSGFERVTRFVKPVVLTLTGHNTAGYTIHHNNKPVALSADGDFHVEGMPGDQVRIQKNSTGKVILKSIQQSNQTYRLSALFPQRSGETEKSPGGKGWIKTLAFVALFAAIIGAAAYFTLSGNEEETLPPTEKPSVDTNQTTEELSADETNKSKDGENDSLKSTIIVVPGIKDISDLGRTQKDSITAAYQKENITVRYKDSTDNVELIGCPRERIDEVKKQLIAAVKTNERPKIPPTPVKKQPVNKAPAKKAGDAKVTPNVNGL